jgi:putative oxidoreductase
MKTARASLSASDSQPAGFFEGLFILFGRIPDNLILFAARLFPAAVFWMSGRTKMDGWTIADRAYFLFEQEYRLPLLDPELAARLATTAEHVFPVLLVIGLATRFSALALLGMTLTIQIFVYPNAWPTHGLWATCFLIVIAKGPGLFSLDHLIRGRFADRA